MNPALRNTFAGLALGLSLAGPASGQISNFDNLNGYAAGLEARVAANRELLFRAGSVQTLSGLTVTTQYTDRKIDAANDRIERDTQSRSAQLGYAWKLGDWALGLAVAAEASKSDYIEINSPAPLPLRGAVDSDTTSGQVFLAGHFGAVHVNAAVGIGRTEHQGTRISDIGSSRGEFDSDDVFYRLQFAYDHVLSDTLLLQPSLGLASIRADADGFTEQGTAPDRRILRDFSARETMVNLGLRLSGRQEAWRPSVAISWFREASVKDTTLTSTAINGANLGAGTVPNSARSLFHASVRLDGNLGSGWKLGGEVQYLTGGDERQWGLQLGLNRGF